MLLFIFLITPIINLEARDARLYFVVVYPFETFITKHILFWAKQGLVSH
jgi:hypothetical protein